jgi:hypothetical protein
MIVKNADEVEKLETRAGDFKPVVVVVGSGGILGCLPGPLYVTLFADRNVR